MRAGWNEALEKRVRRADPSARIILEAVAVGSEDVRHRLDEWQTADSTVGFELRGDGAVVLQAATQQQSAITSSTAVVELRTDQGDEQYCALEYSGEQAYPSISQISFNLVSQQDPARAKEIASWKLELFALYEEVRDGEFVFLNLAPIADPYLVAAPGTIVAGDVVFDYTTRARALPHFVSRPSFRGPATSAPMYPSPTILARLRALKADGTPATNAGLSLGPIGNTGPFRLTVHSLTTSEQLQRTRPGFLWDEGANQMGPRMSVLSRTYAAATIGFTSALNEIDLGAAPADSVELVGQGDVVGNTSIVCEVKADDGTWVEFRDGDLADTDNTARGGTNLSATGAHRLSARRTYLMRATLAPGVPATETPALRALGARSVEVVDLDGVASLPSASWSTDPVTKRGEITEASISLIRDAPRDYRDLATDLFARIAVGGLEFRAWLGASDLPRAEWMLIDSFIVDDYMPAAAEIGVVGLGVLAEVKGIVPPPVVIGASVTRSPKVYANQALPAIYADLLGGQIGVAERRRGPGIPVSVTATASNTLDEVDGKTALDAVARLAGGTVISSQGRVKWVDLHGEQTVAAVFAAEEIRPLGAAPGLRQRVPEFFVKYKWQEKENESGRYLSEVRSFHTAALAAVGSARLDAPKVLEDDVARWVDTDELAGAEAARVTTSLGAGLILWSFETPYPFPELEVGDLVTVACDWFVASDPVASRELRGQIWATGVVVRQHDPWGRGFDIWIRNYSDLVPASAVVDRDGYAPLPTVTATVTNDGPNATVAVQGSSTAVTLWYQELVAGVWSAEVQFASGQAGSFTLAKSETGVRTLRVYAKNAAAAAGTTQPVELDRYEDPSLSHQPPSVSIRQAQTPAATRKKIWLAFSIALGEGGTSPLSWSVQVDEQRGATGTPSAFSTAAAPIAFEVDRGRYGKVVTLTAKDADGRQSSTRYTVAGTQTSGTEPTAGGRQQYARAGLGGTAAVLHSAVDVRDASGLVTLVDPASSSFANATLQDTVSDPRGRTVGAALVKPGGVGAPDTADSIGDGLTRRVTTHNEATGGGRGYAGFKNGSGGLVATATVDDGKGDRPVENVRASGRRATRRGAQQLGGHAADTRRGGIGGVPGQTRVSAPIRDTSGLMTLVDPATATFANGTLQDTVQDARGRVVGAALVKSGGVAATDTADSIGDGLTKRVTSNSEATGGARAYTALDSNSRLTDARRANMALTAGRGSTQYNYGATLLSVTRDSGTLVTVTVAAHTLRVSGIDINYNSGSCVFSSLTATSNNGKPFYVYASDPLYSGGAVTYLASLNKEDVQGASGYYFVGQGTVPAASGSGSGGGGGGMV